LSNISSVSLNNPQIFFRFDIEFFCRIIAYLVRHIKLFVVFSLFASLNSYSQKVGLVLSGGGAAGLSHIGVIKALEENNIPIDFVTGTSMGALVGIMYSIGMTPQEMEALVVSGDFKNWASGIIEDKYIYYFKQRDPNSSWITIKFSPNSIFQSSLPTNIISPVAMDLNLMEKLSGPAAAANYNFDSLFVPFRCVAADVVAKKQVIFRKGNLNEAIRASMAFPFYLKPITVDSCLLFDGGLYNNFPSDVMYEDFYPDIIIGSSLSIDAPPLPDEDNLFSQIRSMLVTETNYTTICENGIMINPKTETSLFEFDDASLTIEKGYLAALLQMDEIKARIERRTDSRELDQKRKEFKVKIPELIIGNIHIEGLKKNQSQYVHRLLMNKDNDVKIERFKKQYYRLISDDKIKQIFPVAIYNKSAENYDLFLKIKKERELIANFGGNVSNRAINQGFVGLQYNYLGHQAITLNANTYFGKLYGSGQVKARIDFPYRLPFFVEGGITLNRWDFFKSSNAFFEDVKPSYLIHHENFGEMSIAMPVFNKGKIKASYSYVNLRNEYYQTRNFSVADTADRTTFNLVTGSISYDRNSLNRKQYASEGSFFQINARYIQGEEFTKPGSTAKNELPFRGIHEWMQFKMTFDNYYKGKGRLKLGFYAEAIYSTQPFFHNYTGTILAAPAFMPTPETQTIFLEKFRAYNYGAFGLKNIFSLRKNMDIRLEAYAFMPYREIFRNEDQTAAYGPVLSSRKYIATTAFVYHTPLGPLSLSVNYYDKQEEPWSFLFHFGYILFNRRALE
jgi:NTE family protein